MGNQQKYKTAKAGVKISVRLPPFIYFRLREIADKHNVSLSVVFRALLSNKLNEIIDENGYEKDQRLW